MQQALGELHTSASSFASSHSSSYSTWKASPLGTVFLRGLSSSRYLAYLKEKTADFQIGMQNCKRPIERRRAELT